MSWLRSPDKAKHNPGSNAGMTRSALRIGEMSVPDCGALPLHPGYASRDGAP